MPNKLWPPPPTKVPNSSVSETSVVMTMSHPEAAEAEEVAEAAKEVVAEAETPEVDKRTLSMHLLRTTLISQPYEEIRDQYNGSPNDQKQQSL